MRDDWPVTWRLEKAKRFSVLVGNSVVPDGEDPKNVRHPDGLVDRNPWQEEGEELVLVWQATHEDGVFFEEKATYWFDSDATAGWWREYHGEPCDHSGYARLHPCEDFSVYCVRCGAEDIDWKISAPSPEQAAEAAAIWRALNQGD